MAGGGACTRGWADCLGQLRIAWCSRHVVQDRPCCRPTQEHSLKPAPHPAWTRRHPSLAERQSVAHLSRKHCSRCRPHSAGKWNQRS